MIRLVPSSIDASTKYSKSKYYFDKLKIKQWVVSLGLAHSKLFIFIFEKGCNAREHDLPGPRDLQLSLSCGLGG